MAENERVIVLRRTIASGLLIVLSFFGGAISAWAGDVDDGDTAFHNGDYVGAIKLLMPLAQQGNAVAELDIGLMYYTGRGMAQDRREATKWFLLSAKQGQVGAQVDLGIAYATGDGVQRSPVQAYVWFGAAALQQSADNPAARYRDHVATELSPDQLQRAKNMAMKCHATNYEACGEE